MNLGDKILAIASEHGWSLKEVSERSGIPYNTLRAYTRPGADTVPTAPAGIALARALGVNAEWLFDGSQGLPPVRYLPPWPLHVATLFGDEIWEEVGHAVLFYRHERQCQYLATVAAMMVAQGRDTEAEICQSFLKNKRQLWDAVQAGDYGKALELRDLKMQLVNQFDWLRTLAETLPPSDPPRGTPLEPESPAHSIPPEADRDQGSTRKDSPTLDDGKRQSAGQPGKRSRR